MSNKFNHYYLSCICVCCEKILLISIFYNHPIFILAVLRMMKNPQTQGEMFSKNAPIELCLQLQYRKTFESSENKMCFRFLYNFIENIERNDIIEGWPQNRNAWNTSCVWMWETIYFYIVNRRQNNKVDEIEHSEWIKQKRKAEDDDEMRENKSIVFTMFWLCRKQTRGVVCIQTKLYVAGSSFSFCINLRIHVWVSRWLKIRQKLKTKSKKERKNLPDKNQIGKCINTHLDLKCMCVYGL